MRAIEAECARRGLMMFLADTYDDPGQELRVVQALHQRRVDDIIPPPTVGPERSTTWRRHESSSVMVDRITEGRFDQVDVENVGSIADLVGHGDRRVGFLRVGRGPISRPRSSGWTGYRLALDRAAYPIARPTF
ncbi:MAG: hypothetical protein VB142_04070 [Burkholderia sp.]